MRVMNKALKIAGISKLHLGLIISIKLNEMLIDAIAIFLAFMGRLKRLFAKTACGQKYFSLYFSSPSESCCLGESTVIIYKTERFLYGPKVCM